MQDRIRDLICDLICDIEIKDLIHKGIQDVFFKEKRITHGYSKADTFEPSLMNDIVRHQIELFVKVAVEHWIINNERYVMDVVNRTVQEGAGSAMNNIFSM